MVMFAEMTLPLYALIGWAAVGLVVGRLAHKVLGAGGYGATFDLVAGLFGGVVGGFLFDVLKTVPSGEGGMARFAQSLTVAALGACLLIFGGRLLGIGQRS
jgi:uncharacterized membrane protein YeaQ/YmgE (transglycosylase-associated protein family)